VTALLNKEHHMQFIRKLLGRWSDYQELYALLSAFFSLHNNTIVQPASLAINAGTAVFAKTTNAAFFLVKGVLVKVAAAAAMPVLTGISIPNGSKQIVGFTITGDGTLARIDGNVSTTVAGLQFPVPPNDNSVVIGYLIIENGTGSTFTGNTTALDAGSLTVTYVNETDAFYPVNNTSL
jgi:hypothetical protein